MKTLLLAALLFLVHIEASEGLLAPPPATFVHKELSTFLPHIPKVNVITGEYHEEELDLVVAGCEPVSIRRFYGHLGHKNQAYGHWSINPETLMLFNFKGYRFAGIGDEDGNFTVCENDHGGRLSFNLGRHTSVTNTGQYHPLNVFFSYRKVKDGKHEKYWDGVITDGTGRQRHYRTQIGLWDEVNDPVYQGWIKEERKPNGNILYYDYEDFNDKSKKNKHYKQLGTYYTLRSISAYSAAGTFLGSISLSYPDQVEGTFDGPVRYIKRVEITGSDQRSATYYNSIREVSPKKKSGVIPAIKDVVLAHVVTPTKPQQSYAYIHDKAGRYFSHPFMYSASQPEGRALLTVYDIGTKKVIRQEAPVGPNGEMHPIASYTYNADHTIVNDAENNQTIYRYNGDMRITSIEKYQGTQLYSVENNEWNGSTGNLMRKSLNDSSGNLIRVVEYAYDQNHNPELQRTSYTRNHQLGWDIISTTHSDDGFNLKLTESDRPGKEIKYTYLPGTNLLTSEIVYCDGCICKRSFCFYDRELGSVCIKTIVDDGKSTNPDDLTGVSFRKITHIAPKRTLPCIGLPETVSEKTIDQSGHEILLHKVVYAYHPSGKVLKEDHYDANDAHRYSIINTYDAQERLTSTTDALGHKTFFTYDTNGNITSQTGPTTQKEWVYDAANRPTVEKERQTDGTLLITKKKYDKLSRVIATLDECGIETRYTYDSLGRVVAIHHPDSIERKEYDVLDNVTGETDGNGYTTHKTYNFRGQPVSICHPDGTQEHFTYNDNSKTLASHVTKSGVKKVYTYDHLDHLIKTETFTPSGELYSVVSATYTPFHKLSETDAEGITTYYTYDYAGRMIAKQIGEQIVRYTYNELGNLTHTEQGDVTTIQSYDLKDRLLETRIESTQTHFQESYSYDVAGNRIETTTCAGTTSTAYNTRNQPIVITDPLGNTTHITYNYGDCLTKTTTNPKGIQTIETYDSRGRLIDHQVKEAGQTIQREEKQYDPAGNLIHTIQHIYQGTTLKDIVMNSWIYGPGSRLEQLIEAGSKITQYLYDEVGRLKTTIKPDGEPISRNYDAFGRLSRYYGKDIDYHYTYDRKDRLLKVEDALQPTTTTRNYDIYDNIIEEKLANGLVLSSQYDHYGKRVALHLPDSSQITYTYKGPYLHTISRNGFTHTYTSRNLAGKPTQSNDTTLTWDTALHLQSIQAPHYQAQATYDCLGNLQTYTYTDTLGTVNNVYQYDPLNQLISENDGSYQYDSLSNRTAKNQHTYTLNSLSHVTHDGQKHYTYDPNGNLISDGTTTYTYDVLDRLIATHGKTHTTYTYDPFNRRISKDYEYYMWDDQHEIGTASSWGRIKELRILGEGIAEIGAAVILEIGGYTYFPIHDIQGSPVILLYYNTPYGNYRYTAFGEQLAGDHISPWRFASKRLDKETGLLFFGRRYYSPNLGRWITADPQGFDDGPNLYAYVHNNPLTNFDPFGLWSCRGVCGGTWDYLGGALGHAWDGFYGMAHCAYGIGELGFAGLQSAYYRDASYIREDWSRSCQTLSAVGKAICNAPFEAIAPGVVETWRNPTSPAAWGKATVDVATALLAVGKVGQVAKVGSRAARVGRVGRVGEELTALGKSASVSNIISEPSNLSTFQYRNLVNQLAREEAHSVFTPQGTLSKEALARSKEIIPYSVLKNSTIPTGFSKYTTEIHRCPSGSFQVHYYRHPITGNVCYDFDYKSVFTSRRK